MTGDDPLDCDFEKDLCSWTQGRGDDFDLVRYQGNTLTAMTGPSSDHTIGGSKKEEVPVYVHKFFFTSKWLKLIHSLPFGS